MSIERINKAVLPVLRVVTGVAVLLLTTAASPPSAAYLISTHPDVPAPTGPQPKRLSAMSYSAAPMPNSDISAPIPRAEPGQASLAPSLFAPRNGYHGEGYVPGSTVQTQQEKRLRPAPGINLSVPLQ